MEVKLESRDGGYWLRNGLLRDKANGGNEVGGQPSWFARDRGVFQDAGFSVLELGQSWAGLSSWSLWSQSGLTWGRGRGEGGRHQSL